MNGLKYNPTGQYLLLKSHVLTAYEEQPRLCGQLLSQSPRDYYSSCCLRGIGTRHQHTVSACGASVWTESKHSAIQLILAIHTVFTEIKETKHQQQAITRANLIPKRRKHCRHPNKGICQEYATLCSHIHGTHHLLLSFFI